MELTINNRTFKLFNNIKVSLQYDSVASTFDFELLFDPENIEHKELFEPGRYWPAAVSHNGELLITGTILVNGFSDSAESSVASVSGYSKTGVLEDCDIPNSAYPLQSNNLSLLEIAQKVTKDFNLNIVVDPSVAAKMNTHFDVSTADDKQSIKDYLTEITSQRHIIMSHTALGELLFTSAAPSSIPVFDFYRGMPGVKMDLDFDGQGMHSEITIKRQQTKRKHKGVNGMSTVQNPYCQAFRPKASRQTSGEVVNVPDVARNALSDELRSFTVKIQMEGWELNNKMVVPNSIVSVLNPNIYIYKRTNLFVQAVEYQGSESGQGATLTCMIPEVFTEGTPLNIFK